METDIDEEHKQAENKHNAPDGGWGWMVVLGAFFIYFIADGCSLSFGVFYTEILDYFHQSKGKTAVIVGLLYGFPLLISPIICALVSSFGCRTVGIIGGILTGCGFLVSMFASSVEALCITIGIFGSIGLAMCYLSAIVSVSFYFEKKRGLATGMAVCGSGFGTLAFAPMIEIMLQTFAWKGCILLVSGICLNMIACAALFRPIMVTVSVDKSDDVPDGNIPLLNMAAYFSPKIYDTCKSRVYHSQYLRIHRENDIHKEVTNINRSYDVRRRASEIVPCLNDQTIKSCPDVYLITGVSSVSRKEHSNSPAPVTIFQRFKRNFQEVVKPMVDPTIPKNVRFMIFVISNFIFSVWSSIPYVYMTDLAKTMGFDLQKASLLISTVGISSTVGQISLGFLNDKARCPLLIYALSMVVCGMSLCFVPISKEYWTMCILAAIFGFFVSASYALSSIVIIQLVGLEKLTIAFGWLQLGQGIAILIGTPIAGLLYDFFGKYDIAFYVGGIWIILSGLILIPVIMKYEFRYYAANKDNTDKTDNNEVSVKDFQL